MKRARAAVLALALLGAALGGCSDDRTARRTPSRAVPPSAESTDTAQERAPEGLRTCERVVDGDTVELDGGEKVRLIGVDTPETKDPRRPVQYFGRQASAFTKQMVEGKLVRLEYDRTRRDRYGRTLAYLRLEDGKFVNLEIVREGYGFAYTKYPFRYMDEFRNAERHARAERAGLWADPDSIGRRAS